jgi:hypothetical protein
MLLSRTASALAAHFWLLDLHTAAIAAAIAGLSPPPRSPLRDFSCAAT